MTEEKSEQRMLKEIEEQVNSEVAKAILQAGYQTLLGGDLAKTGLHPCSAREVRNLKQCFGPLESWVSGTGPADVEKKLIDEAFARLVEGKQVSSIVRLKEATGRTAYGVPKELIREEFLYVLKDIKETSGEFPIAAEGEDWMGKPAQDPLKAEISYLRKLQNFPEAITADFIRDGGTDARREIRETQDALADRIFKVEIYSNFYGTQYHNCEKYRRHGIEYALDIAEELGLVDPLGLEPVRPETMQKAFVQYLNTEGMGAVRKLAERAGIRPSLEVLTKCFEEL